MDSWFVLLVTLCATFFLKSCINLFLLSNSSTKKKNLPPGPPTLPIAGNFFLLRKYSFDLEPILRDLKLKYGPLITLKIGSRNAIFVASHSLAHKSLIQKGAIFSDRPPGLPTAKVINNKQHTIASASYGPTWRLLRRNITSEIFHPSRVKSYSDARHWVLGILIHRLHKSDSRAVKVVDHFQYTMFCLLVLMCFGDKLEEKQIKEIETVQRQFLLSFRKFNILNFWPRLGKIVFRNRWKELIELRRYQEAVLTPLIHDRIGSKHQKPDRDKEELVAYVDTLVDLELPDEKRKLNDGEMVNLCSEFLNAGTDTTSTALQWIMANLVKHPQIQAKLYEEIISVVGSSPKEEEEVTEVVKEEDLQRMPYLKAIVLEGLRRHPPGHFVLPHAVTEDVELDGYVVPKNATINFMVADMGWDPKVWENPMEFKPERFFISASGDHQQEEQNGKNGGELFDITGSREIKMMPFGAGRRICPGAGLALLHLEYFVANLVWYFEWKAVDGDDVDLSEKQEFTIVMKNPLRAHITARVK